jgi:[FeFe] hydrogenase H-cluster maturation GTPase HydF
MRQTPKSLRLQIGLFGRTNVGKSSFLNMVSAQQVSITSEHPGTTTDVVEKSMELLPIGPVVFLDTAGIDDPSLLSEKRIERTEEIFKRCDVAVLITDSEQWGPYEQMVAEKAASYHRPVMVVLNKRDLFDNPHKAEASLKKDAPIPHLLSVSSHDKQYAALFKEELATMVPKDLLKNPPILGDLVDEHAHVIFIVPIDIEAPKGRLILPQVQSIRDMLDHDGMVTVVKEDQYPDTLKNFINPPDLVVCDSQVVDVMVEQTPDTIPCTTFSTLFARVKGDLEQLVQGAQAIDSLREEDTVLIAEACSHHPSEDDIGTVKIPGWIGDHLGFTPKIIHAKGRDYPDDLDQVALIIHCGGCMLTRGEMLTRIDQAQHAGVPVTNYGVCISHLKGVLERIIAPFGELSEHSKQRRRA